MKLTLQSRQLAGALQMVARAVSPRSTVQILSAVLVEADKEAGVVRVSATDMEMTMSLRFKAEGGVEEGGRVAIPARVLSDLAKTLPDGPLTLSVPEGAGEATLSQDAAEYKMRFHAADDYPALPTFPEEEGVSFSLPADDLAKAIRMVAPSASRDETRPVLTGVLVSFEGGQATMVTTDSYRMGMRTTDLAGAPEDPRKAVIPARGLSEIARLVGSVGVEEISVALTENAALFKTPGMIVSLRLIEGNFPEYAKLLPSSFAKEFAVDASALAATMKRVNLFTGQDAGAAVRLSFASGEGSLTGGTLTVSVENPETGGATETIEAAVGAGDDLQAIFNGKYLLDGLLASGSQKITFKFNDPMKPAIIAPAPAGAGSGAGNGAGDARTGDADEFLYLLMPMRDPKG